MTIHYISVTVFEKELERSNLLEGAVSIGLRFTIWASTLGATVLGAVALKALPAVLALRG